MSKDLVWFSYDEETGLDLHETKQEAIDAANEAIQAWRDACDPEWSESVENVCWGRVMGTAKREVIQDGDAPEVWDYYLSNCAGIEVEG